MSDSRMATAAAAGGQPETSSDPSDFVDFATFAAMQVNQGVPEAKLRTMFDSLDATHEGVIALADFAALRARQKLTRDWVEAQHKTVQPTANPDELNLKLIQDNKLLFEDNFRLAQDNKMILHENWRLAAELTRLRDAEKDVRASLTSSDDRASAAQAAAVSAEAAAHDSHEKLAQMTAKCAELEALRRTLEGSLSEAQSALQAHEEEQARVVNESRGREDQTERIEALESTLLAAQTALETQVEKVVQEQAKAQQALQAHRKELARAEQQELKLRAELEAVKDSKTSMEDDLVGLTALVEVCVCVCVCVCVILCLCV